MVSSLLSLSLLLVLVVCWDIDEAVAAACGGGTGQECPARVADFSSVCNTNTNVTTVLLVPISGVSMAEGTQAYTNVLLLVTAVLLAANFNLYLRGGHYSFRIE